MVRHRGLIAVFACIVAGVACDGGKLTAPDPPVAPPTVTPSTVTVEFGGRVVDADTGGPVGNVRVSPSGLGFPSGEVWRGPNTPPATSGADGTFTLLAYLPSSWTGVTFELAGPGYDYRYQNFNPTTAADRPAIRMYPTLVIRPGESIRVRVDPGIYVCQESSPSVDCRQVLVAASPGDPVELELVPDDSSKPMALSLGEPFFFEPDMSVRRLMVPPGAGVPYVLGAGTARLTARR